MNLCHALWPLRLAERRSSHSLWPLPGVALSLALVGVITMRAGSSPLMAWASKGHRCVSARGWAACTRRYIACVGYPTRLIVILLLLTPYTAASQVTLVWDASVSMVDGYWLYYGPTSGSYIARIDVGTATTHILTGLENGQTYYFTVTAYDRTGNIESSFSNEVGITLPSTQPPPAGGGTEAARDTDSDGAQGGGMRSAGGGGGCTLNPGMGCDPLVLGMTGLWFLWLAARVRTRGRASMTLHK
jgi:hypothetical protein